MHMEAISGEKTEEYYEVMDGEIQSLIIRYIWEIFQGIQFLITMCFLKHSLSSARVNLIGRSVNSRHYIV